MKKFLNYFLDGVLIIACVYFLLITYFSITYRGQPDKIPSFLGYRGFVVLSGSMEPKISPGDMVIVKKTKTQDFKVGDIVTYKLNNSYVTHRLMKVNDTTAITKGDANNVEDTEFSKSMLYGTYQFKIPYLGYLVVWIKKPVVFIPLLIILWIYCGYNIFRKVETKLTENEKKMDIEGNADNAEVNDFDASKISGLVCEDQPKEDYDKHFEQ